MGQNTYKVERNETHGLIGVSQVQWPCLCKQVDSLKSNGNLVWSSADNLLDLELSTLVQNV